MDPATESEPKPRFTYNAFISYKHDPDGHPAKELQRGLHKFAKPLFALRSMRVFRDEEALVAGSALKESIERALMESEYLIVIASPESAAAPWVDKEIEFWIRNKPLDKILIALTAGNLVWDAQTGGLDWNGTTALPPRLKRVLTREPIWVDLRWMRQPAAGLTSKAAGFRLQLAALAAPILGRSKEELIGDDVRLVRRNLRLAGTAVALLATLSVGLGWMSIIAERRRRVAAAQRDLALISQSRYLADAALRQVADGAPETGVLLALEALPKPGQDRPYVAEAEAALHTAMGMLGVRNTAELTAGRPPLSSAAYSPDGKRLVTVDLEAVRIWNAETGKQISTLRGHREPVWWAAYLPDGGGIVTASADQTARLWNAQTGTQVRVFEGHQGPVLHAAISSDGRLLATASADATARIWRIADGSLVSTLKGHAQAICCIQISSDAARVATASIDGTVRLWNLQNGKTIALIKDTPRRFKIPAGSGAFIAFSPDGLWLATAHIDSSVRLWSVRKGELAAVFKGHTRTVNGGAFSSDSRYLATASADGTARLWPVKEDLDTEKPLLSAGEFRNKEKKPPTSALKSAAFSPDGSFVVIVGEESLKLFDTATREELATLTLDVPADGIAMSVDGQRMATLQMSMVTLWEATARSFMRWRIRQSLERVDRNDAGPIKLLYARNSGMTWEDERGWEPQAAITRDGTTVAAAIGRAVILRSAANGQTIATLAGHSRVVSRLVFDAAGTRLLTTSYDGLAKIWDAHTGGTVATLRGHTKPIFDGAFQPSGGLIATGSEDGTVMLWDANGTAKTVLRHSAVVRRLSFSGDGRRLITIADDRTARLWDPVTGKELVQLHGEPDGFGVAILNTAGDRAVTAGSHKDFTVRLWDAATGKELHRWEQSHGTVTGAAFGVNEDVVLTWGVDALARLWNPHSSYDSIATLGEGCAGFGAVAQGYLSDDERRIVTILRNGRTDVWSRNGTLIFTLHTFPETRSLSGCGFSYPPPPEAASFAATPDLGHVLVYGADGTLVLFDLPGKDEMMLRARQWVTRPLTAEERRRFFLN